MILHCEPLGEAVDALRAGSMTQTAYIQRLCDRIDDVEPIVHALIPEPDRRGRLLRSTLEVESAEPSPDGLPLTGVPIGVKDVFHVAGFETAAGTAVPPDLFTGPEAPVVRRFCEAGAVVLGKTATTEFAGHAPAPTRNPQNPAHTPGGSSSGSAAAVASGLCPLALGTQTGGSVIRPAAFCGVVGFVPTPDRIPTDGIVPRSPSVDAVGLFTQDVAGMAIASAVACTDWTPVEPQDPPALGVPEDVIERASPDAAAVFQAQVDVICDAGFAVHRGDAFADLRAVDEWHRTLTRGEVARVHEWFDDHRAHYREPTVDAIMDGLDVADAELEAAREKRSTVRSTVHNHMEDGDVDLWVTPAAPGPAPRGLAETGTSTMNRPWMFAGLPALTVPVGRIDGLPVGFQLVSRRSMDEHLMAWAKKIMDVLGGDLQ
jgi:Asp-tRNA(Asn)/Glu-tRNA(Gln) amidotransferase A subunit family amidase